MTANSINATTFFLIGNMSTIIDEKEERNIKSVHDDEQRKALTLTPQNLSMCRCKRES